MSRHADAPAAGGLEPKTPLDFKKMAAGTGPSPCPQTTQTRHDFPEEPARIRWTRRRSAATANSRRHWKSWAVPPPMRDADRSPWDFAVEIESLTEAGLTTSDLRWLVTKGYLEQAYRLPATVMQRRFNRAGTWLSASGRVSCDRSGNAVDGPRGLGVARTRSGRLPETISATPPSLGKSQGACLRGTTSVVFSALAGES